jgi:hypothetical protein
LDGELAGLGCLRWHPGPEVELDTFGLVPEYIGLGYGGYALTLLTRAAWTLTSPYIDDAADAVVQRVWLQTSSWDHFLMRWLTTMHAALF